MQIHSKEHSEMMDAFERSAPKLSAVVVRGMRFDRENKESWSKGFIYQHGETNNLFLTWRSGYAAARSVYLS